MRPLRGGTAATGRQGERTAYPITAPGNEVEFIYMYMSSVLVITQVMSPISKEQNLLDAHFYVASTGNWTNAYMAARNSSHDRLCDRYRVSY